MIREAELIDMENMLVWCEKLHHFSGQIIPFCDESMRSFLVHMIEGGNNLVIVNDFGILVGGFAPSFWNYNYNISSELFIWQDTDHRDYKGEGYQMLKYYEDWAIVNGVAESGMTQQNLGKDLSPLFKRLGYKMKEISYSKEHI